MACYIWKGCCIVGLSSLPVRQAEGKLDGNGLADSNLTAVLRKRSVIAMSMGTARKWLETRPGFEYPSSVR